jgi:hypothetical protein
MPQLLADTLSFCHYEGGFWWFFGLLQYLPWFIGPSFFLASHWGSGDIFLRLLFFLGKMLFILLWVLQDLIKDPVPFPDQCTDIWGSRFGQPAMSAGLITFYCVAVIIQQMRAYFECRRLNCPLTAFPARALAWAIGINLLTLTVLYINGLHTAGQVWTGALVGFAFALIAMFWIYDIFVPHFLPICTLEDPTILGKVFGRHDTFLRPHIRHTTEQRLSVLDKEESTLSV